MPAARAEAVAATSPRRVTRAVIGWRPAGAGGDSMRTPTPATRAVPPTRTQRTLSPAACPPLPAGTPPGLESMPERLDGQLEVLVVPRCPRRTRSCWCPSAERRRRPGRSPPSSVPASTTSAVIVPAGRSALASLGLVRPAKATSPLARTSTAGAAASCRTVSRALPAAIVGDVVDVRRERRLAAGVQVRDDGDVRAGRDVDALGLDDGGAAGSGSGRGDLEVVRARRAA